MAPPALPKGARRGTITPGAIWRFGRPHTIIGTTVSIISVTLCGIDDTAQLGQPAVQAAILVALVSSLLMNVYIVGLNQMTDVAIDRINKPLLPVASGELTVSQGWALVLGSLCGSLFLGWLRGTPALMWTLVASMALGTAYSVEPVRLKKFPVFAALCILGVRGLIVQLGFYHHLRQTMEAAGIVPPAAAAPADAGAGLLAHALRYPWPVLFATAFMTIFAVVIALFKDLPDVRGDKEHGVRTFSVRMGVDRVFRVCVALLLLDYALGVAVGLVSQVQWSWYTTTAFHAAAGAAVLARARGVVAGDIKSLTSFYMFVWKLFYLEYAVLPFVR